MIRLVSGFLLYAVVWCGCARFQPAPATAPAIAPAQAAPADSPKIEKRNNAVSLLYDLVGDEQNVNKVLLIKHGSAELGRLIDGVSATAGDISKRLERMALEDPALKLHALGLPAGEKATRAAIAKTEEHELLFSSGDNFQLQLLLTQADALSYGWHLAGIAADNSSRPEEAHAFTEMSVALQDLYQQVVALLQAPKNH